MLRWLERKLGHLAVPNLTLILLVGQAATFLLTVAQPSVLSDLSLIPKALLAGEVWRLLTFPFVAPLLYLGQPTSAFVLLGFIFYAQLFYLFGTALEQHWGVLRYNLYLLIGYFATVAASFASFSEAATNSFLYGSVFLAFATLNPDFIIHVFLIIPTRIKWLAMLTWIGYAYGALVGDWGTRLLIIAAVLNYFLFFWRDLLGLARNRYRGVKRRAAAAAEEDTPFHRCTVCRKTEQSDPRAEFRYARTENGVECFCLDHLPERGGADGEAPAA